MRPGHEIDVHIENGVIVLSEQRTLEHEDTIRTYHRIEGPDGAFSRSFELSAGVPTTIHALTLSPLELRARSRTSLFRAVLGLEFAVIAP